MATPILNYPEVGDPRGPQDPEATDLPLRRHDRPGQFMNLSVSLDHRVIDGIVGAQFLSVVKAHLEDPTRSSRTWPRRCDMTRRVRWRRSMIRLRLGST